MAVNCTSAGLPHHSQRLPRGAESTATGWRNSFFDIRYPPSSCYWLVKNNVTNTYQGKPVSSGQRLWRVHDDTANPGNTHHRPGAASLPPLNYMEKCTATCLSPGNQSMYLHYSTFSRNVPVKSSTIHHPRATARVARTILRCPLYLPCVYCTGDPRGRPGVVDGRVLASTGALRENVL